MKCMPMKLKVRIFEGKSPELYLAVGHFVLSPACLRENNNYPYKSSRMFTWHVLYHEDQVVAFMPVERKLDGGYKIDNYYGAYKIVFEYIEGFYNTTRMHSHCGYESPQDFENNI